MNAVHMLHMMWIFPQKILYYCNYSKLTYKLIYIPDSASENFFSLFLIEMTQK